MKLIKREELTEQLLPGRIIQKSVGEEAFSLSRKMTMGFARYCEEAGPMEPHQHAEEIVYIINSDRATVRYGAQKNNLGEAISLISGMTLHIQELEWHIFEYENGGSLDIIFFYGQTENNPPGRDK